MERKFFFHKRRSKTEWLVTFLLIANSVIIMNVFIIEGIKFFTTFSSNGGKDTFNDTRRELKKVVKYKILNNLRNAKPFKKKLGSHKIARKVVKN